ncbi:MAG: hypothetical protein HYZ43_06875 [Flavobacteriia bacterium]|jgi:hypothetical protein|nr:hypothetical protein [Flavobacteriia bacterium]
MKIEKRDVNIFLTLWIKHDRELWSELRDIQIRLLVDRIIKEMTFKEMGEHYKVPEGRMKQLFEAILIKIDRCVSSEVAKHLRNINDKLSERPDRPFTVTEIFLN